MSQKIATIALAALTSWVAMPEDADAGFRHRGRHHNRGGSACCAPQVQPAACCQTAQPIYVEPSQPAAGACCGGEVTNGYGSGYQGQQHQGQVYGAPGYNQGTYHGQGTYQGQGGYQGQNNQGWNQQGGVQGGVNVPPQGNTGSQMQGGANVQGGANLQGGAGNVNAGANVGGTTSGNANIGKADTAPDGGR